MIINYRGKIPHHRMSKHSTRMSYLDTKEVSKGKGEQLENLLNIYNGSMLAIINLTANIYFLPKVLLKRYRKHI